jgi:Zn-dependent protease with chaperone function
MESLRFVRLSGNRKGSGGGIVVLLFLSGAALWLIGSVGVFFARLIQCSVSRQREYLADASAVQFTRNPMGLAGALKRIGAPCQRTRCLFKPRRAFRISCSPCGGFGFDGCSLAPPLLERIHRLITLSTAI